MVTFGINPLLKTAGHGKFPPAILLMRFPLRGHLREAHSSAPPQTASSILFTCPWASGQALIWIGPLAGGVRPPSLYFTGRRATRYKQVALIERKEERYVLRAPPCFCEQEP